MHGKTSNSVNVEGGNRWTGKTCADEEVNEVNVFIRRWFFDRS